LLECEKGNPPNARAKILVVDDEQTIASTLREILEMHGYEVRAALSGAQAVSDAAGFAPDFLLVDTMFRQEMDGIEAATRIKAMGCDCKVLFVSGHVAFVDSAFERARGFDFEFAAKPVHPTDLLRMIGEMLRKKRAEKSLVLLVEHSGELRAAMKSALIQAGFAVREAATGAEAVDIVAKYAVARALGRAGFGVREEWLQAVSHRDARRKPDAVILEANLPDARGVEVRRAIRQSLLGIGEIPVVYLAPREDLDEVEAEARAFGAARVLAHPVEMNTLVSTLRDLLRAA
jgi:CheY-like chemotaxis protein